MKNKYFAILFTSAFFVTSCVAQEDDDNNKGYFWYKEPPKEQGEEENEKTDLSQFQKSEPKHYTQEEMMKMHPDFLAVILDEHHKYAIQTLEEKDYVNYMYVLDTARRKAAAATSLHGLAILDNPDLNPNSDYPLTNASRTSKNRVNEKLINSRLRSESSSYALGFFVSETCNYCKDQMPAIRLFQDKTGWNITNIDINKRPDLAERFQVSSTPQIVLIKRNSDLWKKVAIGVESLPKIEQNTYKTIRLIEGEITASQFNTIESQDGGYFDTGER